MPQLGGPSYGRFFVIKLSFCFVAHFKNIGFVQAFLPYMSMHSART